MYSWMISDILEARTEEEEAQRQVALKETKPMNFFKKFIELKCILILANSWLIDEHPFKSRPTRMDPPDKRFRILEMTERKENFHDGKLCCLDARYIWRICLLLPIPKDKFLEHRGSVKFAQDHFFQEVFP